MKYLVLFAVVIVGLLLIKKSQQPRPLHRPKPDKPQPPEAMLPCAHCGVHAPASRCVWRDGKPYCSEEHARLGS
jgi:uncharacterized protein